MSKPLPDSVQQIAEVIGDELALRLVDKLPRAFSKGHRAGEPVLYVPKVLPPDHRLVAIIGWTDALKLSRHFGGELMFLATCSLHRKATRNDDILKLLGSASPGAVAIRFGISERQVRRVAAAARADIPPMERGHSRTNHAPDIPQASVA